MIRIVPAVFKYSRNISNLIIKRNIMKKILILQFISFLIVSSVYAVDPKELDVKFSSDTPFIIGFSDARISSTRPVSENADIEIISSVHDFHLDDSHDYFITDEFYLFVQIFDPIPYEVNITSCPDFVPTGGEGKNLSYRNIGATKVTFSGSQASTPVCLLNESTSINADSDEETIKDSTKPRFYNFGIQLQVPFKDIVEDEYNTTISVEIKSC